MQPQTNHENDGLGSKKRPSKKTQIKFWKLRKGYYLCNPKRGGGWEKLETVGEVEREEEEKRLSDQREEMGERFSH